MFILTPPGLHIDRWLKQGVRWATLALVMACLGVVMFFFLYSWEGTNKLSEYSGGLQRQGRLVFSYEGIGSGSLALRPRYALGWVSRLAEELVLMGYNSRPDVDLSQAQMLLYLKHGKQERLHRSGEILYLKESDQGKGLLVSEDPTDLCVKPLLLDNGTLLVEARRRLVSKEGFVGEETGEFMLGLQGGGLASYNPIQQPFAKEVKTARCFSTDLLMETYGGREYAHWKDKKVLELTSGSKAYACFVASGDYLLFDGGQWQVVAREELKKHCPIAYVKGIMSGVLEVQAWDQAGLYLMEFNIPIQKQGHIELKTEVMPSKIRLRSSSQVSCVLGNRRIILRQGDWLLKTSSGWRNLRKVEEIQDYLNHGLKGELFVFDGIEKEQGRSVMRGHFFDETRTQVQRFSLPIDAEKPENKKVRKRKPFLAQRGKAA